MVVFESRAIVRCECWFRTFHDLGCLFELLGVPCAFDYRFAAVPCVTFGSSLSLPPSVFPISTSDSVPSISSIVSVISTISTISTISINSTIYGIRHLASFPLPIEGAQLFVMPPLLYLPSDSDIIRSLPAYYHPLSSFPWILASNSETNASASLATSALLKTVITRTSHLPTLRATTGHQLTSDALLKYGKTSPLFPLPSGALEAYTKFEIGMSVEMGNFDPYALVLFVEHVLKPM